MNSRILIVVGLILASLLAMGFLAFVLFQDSTPDSEPAGPGTVGESSPGDLKNAAPSEASVKAAELGFAFDERLASVVDELRAAIYENDRKKIVELLEKYPGLLRSSIAMCIDVVETENDKKIPITALWVLKKLWLEDPAVDQVILNRVMARLLDVLKNRDHIPLQIDLVNMLAKKGYLPARDTIVALAMNRGGDLSLQVAAISVLYRICDASVVPDLLALFQGASDSNEIQRAIIKVLAKFDDPAVIEDIIEIAKADLGRKGVLHEILKTLGLLGDDQATAFLTEIARSVDQPNWLRIEAIRSLYLIASEDAVAQLTDIFNTEDDQKLRFDALHKVGRLAGELEDADLRKQIHEQLVSVLDSQTAKRNYDLAARSLIYSGDPEHVDRIIDALRRNEKLDPEMLQKYAAYGKEGYVEKLKAALEAESEDRMKAAIVDTLGRSKDPEAVESILTMLRNEDESDLVKEKAAYALAWSKDARALPDLKTLALTSESAEARVAAVATIGDIGGQSAYAILEELKEAEDISVRMAASGQFNRVKVDLFGKDPNKKKGTNRFRKWEEE